MTHRSYVVSIASASVVFFCSACSSRQDGSTSDRSIHDSARSIAEIDSAARDSIRRDSAKADSIANQGYDEADPPCFASKLGLPCR